MFEQIVGTQSAVYLDDSDKTLGSTEQHFSSLDVEMFSVEER
jgi:hypothetical protein